jgi:hypothetical protein
MSGGVWNCRRVVADDQQLRTHHQRQVCRLATEPPYALHCACARDYSTASLFSVVAGSPTLTL